MEVVMSVVLEIDEHKRFMVFHDGILKTHRRNEVKARRDAELYAGGKKYTDKTKKKASNKKTG